MSSYLTRMISRWILNNCRNDSFLLTKRNKKYFKSVKKFIHLWIRISLGLSSRHASRAKFILLAAVSSTVSSTLLSKRHKCLQFTTDRNTIAALPRNLVYTKRCRAYSTRYKTCGRARLTRCLVNCSWMKRLGRKIKKIHRDRRERAERKNVRKRQKGKVLNGNPNAECARVGKRCNSRGFLRHEPG